MTNALRIFFVTVCFVILTTPALNMVVPVLEQAPLIGAVAEVARPTLSLSGLSTAKYQKDFTAYFEQCYGVRPLATRLDNSLAYWVFHEVTPGKLVRVGTNGVLYLDQQMALYNRRDQPDAAVMAEKIAHAQRLLMAHGKVLVVMMMPTKTAIWPEDVPAAWSVDDAASSQVRSRITDGYVDALTRAGAVFVDGRRAVAALPREATYTRTGRHLAAPATCLILAAAFDLARPHLGEAQLPSPDCTYRLDHDVALEHEDYDLFMLLNVWAPRPANPIPVMTTEPSMIPRERRPDTMLIGSSFGWKVVVEAERSRALRHLYFHYYATSLYDRDGGPPRPLALRSKEWEDIVASTTLFLYAVPEEFLIHDGDRFFDAVVAAYDVASSALSPVTP